MKTKMIVITLEKGEGLDGVMRELAEFMAAGDVDVYQLTLRGVAHRSLPEPTRSEQEQVFRRLLRNEQWRHARGSIGKRRLQFVLNELAANLRVPLAHVNQWRSGERAVPLSLIDRLAGELHAEIEVKAISKLREISIAYPDAESYGHRRHRRRR